MKTTIAAIDDPTPHPTPCYSTRESAAEASTDDRGARARRLIDAAREQVQAAGRHGDRVVRRPIPPDSIPGYSLLRELHRGGQGAVYAALQHSTGREVAVKLLRDSALATPLDRVRFQREIRALARLQHPHIVRLHDGGATEDRCFYVMDLVGGHPLDAYLAATPLEVPDKLNLFLKICDALAAAHLRGVIHRDLKPSNVLVDEGGEPRVLDFGLAKLVEDSEVGESVDPAITVTGQFVGSLPWATPEQVTGAKDQIDVRTDVYALGLLLFHMLTGRFPYPVAGPHRDVLNTIVQTEATLPSAMCGEIDDDVDTIVRKCLQKDRDRRYQSAAELREDVRRRLAGEPIAARADSTWYVLNKTVRRHRTAAWAAGLIFVLLVSWSATATVLLQRARQAERLALDFSTTAQRRSQQLRDMITTVVREMSASLDGISGGGRVRRAIVERMVPKVEELIAAESHDPDILNVYAEALVHLGDMLVGTGDSVAALSRFRRALDIRRELAAADPDDVELAADLSISIVKVGDVTGGLGDKAGWRRHYEEALAIDERLVARHPDNLHFLDNLLWSYDRMRYAHRGVGNATASEGFLDKALLIAERLVARQPQNPLRVYGLFTMVRAKGMQGFPAGHGPSCTHCRRTCDLADKLVTLDPLSPTYMSAVANWYIDRSHAARDVGDFENSERWLVRASALAESLHRANPDRQATTRVLLRALKYRTVLDRTLGDFEAAERHFRELLLLAEAMLREAPEDPLNHELHQEFLGKFAHFLFARGRFDEAREYFVRMFDAMRRAVEASNATPILLIDYANELCCGPMPELHDVATAIALAESAVEATEAVGWSPEAYRALGQAYCAAGRFEEGIAAHLEGLAIARSHPEFATGLPRQEAALEKCRAASAE